MDITLERIFSLLPRKADGKVVHGAKKKFCENIGAPTNIFSEWERGVSRSYRNYLFQISVKYNVSMDWLQGKTDEQHPDSEQEEQKEKIENAVNSMTRDELLRLIRLATDALESKAAQ